VQERSDRSSIAGTLAASSKEGVKTLADPGKDVATTLRRHTFNQSLAAQSRRYAFSRTLLRTSEIDVI